MMTKAATTTSWTIIRMLLGIVLRISDIITFENAVTAVTEIPMTIAGSSFAVTAKQEHMPRTCTITGLSFDRGLNNAALFFLFKTLDKLQFLYYNGNGGHLYVVLKTT